MSTELGYRIYLNYTGRDTETGKVPTPVPGPRCEGCSLKNICMPEITSVPGKVSAVNRGLFAIEE